MRYGISVPNFIPDELAPSDGSHIHRIVGWARSAEAAGWDGFFIWDHLLFWKTWRLQIDDPWVLLAAIASATERVRIGALVTPVPRRRPWKLARECVSIDHLSRGRLVLGFGLGAPAQADYEPFAEPGDNVTLAQKLDEGLDVLCGLWRGQPFSYGGRHYQVDDVTFLPPPRQLPHPPIWIGGIWPHKAPMRRAARWNGVVPIKMAGSGGDFASLLPSDIHEIRAYIDRYRTSSTPFDVVVGGGTPGNDPGRATDIVGPLVEAGITWWVESLDWFSYKTPESITERISQGPPPPR